MRCLAALGHAIWLAALAFNRTAFTFDGRCARCCAAVWECWRLWGEVAHSADLGALQQLPLSIQVSRGKLCGNLQMGAWEADCDAAASFLRTSFAVLLNPKPFVPPPVPPGPTPCAALPVPP